MQDKIMDDIDRLDLTKDVREDVDNRFEIGKKTAERNRKRFGVELTEAEQRQMDRDFQQRQASTLSGELTDARLLTKDIKEAAEAGLYNQFLASYNQGMSALASGGAAAYGKMGDYQALKTRYQSNTLNNVWSMMRSWLG